jgi:hypothetical protein
MERCEDPADPLNSAKYQTGKKCIERGCERPAGTAWSKFWCQPHNAARMARISSTLDHELARLQGKVPADGTPPNTEVCGNERR